MRPWKTSESLCAMTDETPNPDLNPEPIDAPLEPTEAPEGAAPVAEAPTKKRLPLPPISGRRRVIAILLVIAACIYLATLKHGVSEDRQTHEVAQKVTGQQRDQINHDILKTFDKNYKGEIRDGKQFELVARVGNAIAQQPEAKNSAVKLKFHLLAEPDSINLYGLSTGDVYITTAMLNRMQTEGQLAAALAHGTAHALVGDMATPVPAGKHLLPLWQYSLEQEHAADALGLRLMSETGYDPNAFGSMLTILAKAYNAGADVSFFTSHPNAPDRLASLDATIKQLYPQGLPTVMSK